MSTAYIVEGCRIEIVSGRERAGQVRWIGTHAELETAILQFASLAKDRATLVLVLIEWQSGKMRMNSRRLLKHGSYSQRSTDGGVPTQVILRHGDRTWKAPANSDRQGVSGEWLEHAESIGLAPSTQPAPGYTLTPRNT